MAMINVGIGISSKKNLIEAAREAAMKAKEKIKTPKVLLVFCTYVYSPRDYPKALEQIQGIFGKKVPLIGASVHGFFCQDKYFNAILAIKEEEKARGISVIALESDYFNVGVGVGTNVDKSPEKAGITSFQQALGNLEYNPSVAYLAMMRRGVRDMANIRPLFGFMFTPGFSPDHCLVHGTIAQAILPLMRGSLRLIGGGASGGLPPLEKWSLKKYPHAHQFFNGKVYTEAVVTAIFGSDLEVGFGRHSPFRPLGYGVFVTKAKGWTIYELNGRPAADVMAELLEKHTPIKREEFIKNAGYALLVHEYNFGVWGIEEAPLMKVPMQVLKDKSIISGYKVEEGMALSLLKADTESYLKANKEAVKKMIEDAGTKDFGFVIYMSAVEFGREEANRREMNTIREMLSEKVPILGLITTGALISTAAGSILDTGFISAMSGISNKLVSEIST